MIRTESYTEQVETVRDLLAAFSAFDHSTTQNMDPEQVDAHAVRLLLRLGALCSLHGPHVPRELIQTLQTTPASEMFAVVNAFLECGRPVQEGEPVRELQQELNHFSRIVDLGEAGFTTPSEAGGAKRLRNSHRLPDSLKVLSELLIVVRARLVQRGAEVVLPVTRRPGLARLDLGETAVIAHPEQGVDYLVAAHSPAARPRKQALFYFEALLAYLTPIEAATAVCTYFAEHPSRAKGLEVVVASVTPTGQTETLHWGTPASGSGGGDVFERALSMLPERSATLGPVLALEVGADHTATISTPGTPTRSLALAPAGKSTIDLDDLITDAATVFSSYQGPPIRSIECGHVHLDRDVDDDQVAGARIGAVLHTHLTRTQHTPPLFTPMVDDDHVLVKLRPRDYTAFLRTHLGEAPFALICESSPIVRAIVCALYQRLIHSPGKDALVQRGNNLFIELPDGNVCELFEDFTGTVDTGCVMFEVALLIYRTDTAAFDAYFAERFPRRGHIHADACQILDTDDGHDTKADQLARLYAPFAPVTDPHHPDADFAAFLDGFLDGLPAPAGHLNVLEDYYEVQQDKVRALIAFLELPLVLSTVHFNTHTGRINLVEGQR
ncbi:hypothetical protein ACWFMI_24635 [Nocardiopsis terrae]|uniref:hypothetical protein n=1 Tax=Streptomyces sp. NPDC057554 TaxID=3350538 RepID=UPI0036980F31